MNPRERGFLLLTSQLGNPERRPLSPAQLRTLSRMVSQSDPVAEDRDLEDRDLTVLGYSPAMAGRIISLLSEEDLLDHYLLRAKQAGCVPITRVTPGYPVLLRKRLGEDAPRCLWAKGDLTLLEQPGIALVGSRDLKTENLSFAREVGRQAALQNLVLISGNARGADREAQNACLEAGGSVISIVADELTRQTTAPNILYLSEDSFDAPFSAQRALSRNRCIHTLGRTVLVAQANLQKGGTWDGVSKNLRFGWTNVCVFRDGSDSAKVLAQMGAELIHTEVLNDLPSLCKQTRNFFDP